MLLFVRIRHSWTIFILFCCLGLSADEEAVLRQVKSHLLISDFDSAKNEVEYGAAQYPTSRKIKELEIEVLARIGDEKQMMARWNAYSGQYPDAFEKIDLLESMSWGVVDKGFWAASPITRAIALAAANLSGSAKGVKLLEKGIQDSNTAVRALALELSMKNRDSILQDRVIDVLENDRAWNARMAALKAAGGMRIARAEDYLRHVIVSNMTTDEERALAVQSLVMILDASSREDVAGLARSRRVGLRLLACEIVAVFKQHEDLDLIIPLLSDHSSQIRKAALQVVGILREKSGKEVRRHVLPMLNDPDREVAIIASWVLILHEDPEGLRAMRFFLQDESRPMRCFAAGVLRSAGKYGKPLIERAFAETADPYVKLNLAIGLIGQRISCAAACDEIYRELTSNQDRWMWREEGIFRSLAPSQVRHREDIPQFPEVVNQLVRLELLQLLAFMEHPGTQNAMKRFLQERTFGITGVVIALMLSEGEEESLDMIRGLLDDPDQKIRAQAALILAIWGREEEVIKELETIYASGSRHVKEKVLEGMGNIGSHLSLPFLTERLSEPHQHLRMIAAAAIIQCVNH